MKQYTVKLLPFLCLLSVFFSGDVLGAVQTVKGDFQNRLIYPGPNPEADVSSSAAFYPGHRILPAVPDNNPSAEIPNDGGSHYLQVSYFGQAFAQSSPYPDFEEKELNVALALLDPDTGGAFRYKNVLYAQDGGEYIRSLFETIHQNWNADDRAKAEEAEQILRNALKYAPRNQNLRNALLDLYYDMAVADLEVAKDKMQQALRAAMGIDTVADSGYFLISKEIPLLVEALNLYKTAMAKYFAILSDPMGIRVSDVDPSVSEEMPFGYYLFQQEVPLRGLNSALPDDKNIELFSNYKDLVLLFTIQKEYVEAATELVKRYIFRNESGDWDSALDLISDIYQSSYAEGNLLLAMFSGAPAADPKSGLTESVQIWQHALAELDQSRLLTESGVNPLGFSDDFLVLVQSVIPGDAASQYFDSYDYFAAYLNNSDGGPLYAAIQDREIAKSYYMNYRDRNDQLAMQFSEKNDIYDERLRQIVGVKPGEAGYDNPSENRGSEIYLQYNNIDMAINRIQMNEQEIENLQKQIEIEIWRRGEEQKIYEAIQQVHIKYGNKYAKITEKTGELSADQFWASSIAGAVGTMAQSVFKDSDPQKPDPAKRIKSQRSVIIAAAITVGASIVSSLFGAEKEKKKNKLLAQREKLMAMERAEIVALQDSLLDANSKAQIMTMLLRMHTLALESVETAIVLEQEVSRLAALENEKISLEGRKDQFSDALAYRYFADPSHRLLKDSSFEKAEFSFKRAQQWMFMAIRALEYKWNKTFSISYGGRIYSVDTLMRLRNAQELSDLFSAMDDWHTKNIVSNKSDDQYVKFSFREDFLGYRKKYTDPITGEEKDATYPDPITGERVNAKQAFKSYLTQESLYLDPEDEENELSLRSLKLVFSTAMAKEASGFFSRENWLDKIQFLRIRVIGSPVSGINSTVQGHLKYGGLSFIRNQYPGILDPDRPDKVIDEMTAYSTRYWYFDSGQWVSKDALGTSVSVQVATDPDVPPTVNQINTFQERSVAASEWSLYLPVEDENGNKVIDISNISDIEIHFYYYWYDRP